MSVWEWCELQTALDSSKQSHPPYVKHNTGRSRTAATWSHHAHFTILRHSVSQPSSKARRLISNIM